MHLTSSTFRHAISHYWCNVTRSARKWQPHSCRVFLLNVNLKKERKKAEKLFQAGFEPGTSLTKIVPSGIQTGDLSNTSLPPDCCTCWGITVEELEGYLICCLRCFFFCAATRSVSVPSKCLDGYICVNSSICINPLWTYSLCFYWYKLCFNPNLSSKHLFRSEYETIVNFRTTGVFQVIIQLACTKSRTIAL